jgi:hypothetical protein
VKKLLVAVSSAARAAIAAYQRGVAADVDDLHECRKPVAYLEGNEIYFDDEGHINDYIRQNGVPLYTHPASANAPDDAKYVRADIHDRLGLHKRGIIMTYQHTQGPWEYDPDESEIKSTVDVSIHEDADLDIPRVMTTVAYLRGSMSGENTQADAYLMAAAPELYEALCDLVYQCSVNDTFSCINTEDAEAAISKARHSNDGG